MRVALKTQRQFAIADTKASASKAMADDYPKMPVDKATGQNLVWRHPERQGLVVFNSAFEEKSFNPEHAVPASSAPEMHSQANYAWAYDPWKKI